MLFIFSTAIQVSAVLYLDEKTPHIHATVVPIVQGERRKAEQEKNNGKKKYRKKSADTVRLWADDVMTPTIPVSFFFPSMDRIYSTGSGRNIMK